MGTIIGKPFKTTPFGTSCYLLPWAAQETFSLLAAKIFSDLTFYPIVPEELSLLNQECTGISSTTTNAVQAIFLKKYPDVKRKLQVMSISSPFIK